MTEDTWKGTWKDKKDWVKSFLVSSSHAKLALPLDLSELMTF